MKVSIFLPFSAYMDIIRFRCRDYDVVIIKIFLSNRSW